MKQNITEAECKRLIEYRRFIYSEVLSQRRDSQFELIDALLGIGPVNSFPELSESSAFRRQWESVYSAVEDGRQQTERLFAFSAQQVPNTGICVFALDVSAWRRLEAVTMADRQYIHQATTSIKGGDVSVGYPYSWLEYVPHAHTSWTWPVHVGRVPSIQTLPGYGAEQIKALCRQRASYLNKLDIIAADGGYGNARFLRLVKDQPCGVVVRLRRDRTLRGRPDRQHTRQTKHGARFDFKDAQTWPPPDEDLHLDRTSHYGQVRIRRWRHWHDVADATTEFDVLRIDTHLEYAQPCEPLWLAWQAPSVPAPIPVSTVEIWLAYDRRGVIESSFRFRKQALMWTTPRFSLPDAGDCWTRLIFIALCQLALARPIVEDRPRPWQPPQPRLALTPARVQRGFANLVAEIGSPAHAPKLRGCPSGWPTGRPRTPKPHFDVVKKRRPRYSRLKT